MPDNKTYGAAPGDWARYTELGLLADLLPVASNPHAKISPDSKLTTIGKVPSFYTPQGLVMGIGNWTSKQTTQVQVDRWSKNPNLGICIQTRNVIAIDIDVEDPDVVDRIVGMLPATWVRFRDNSARRLLIYSVPSHGLSKRIIRLESGIIEMLATGQQFVAEGTHTSGARYNWFGSYDLAELTPDDVNLMWSALEDEFGNSVESKPSVRKEKLSQTVHNDPVAQILFDKGMVLDQAKDGRLDIECPFADGHSTDSSPSSTSYYPAHTGGYQNGHFHCLHASCAHRSDQDYKDALGISSTDFDDLTAPVGVATGGGDPAQDTEDTGESKPPRFAKFAPVSAAEFAVVESTPWIVKNILPKADIAIIFGAPSSGKTFATMDLSFAVAQGIEWFGQKTRQGRVVYLAAEGAGGVRKRLKAYAQRNGIDLANVQLMIIPAAPNLLEKADADDVIRAIRAAGGCDLLVIDTWAQVTAGGDENSGKDMGRALAHCKRFNRYLNCMVLVVHHSGKDATRGARGWSGLLGAVDTQLEVVAADTGARSITVTKQKDGEMGQSYGFRLTEVPIGIDEDGDAITSCVVTQEGAIDKPVRHARKLGNLQQMVMDTFASLGDRVSVHDLEVAVSKLLPDPEDGKRDVRRQHARRAISGLLTDGLLTESGGWVVGASDVPDDGRHLL